MAALHTLRHRLKKKYLHFLSVCVCVCGAVNLVKVAETESLNLIQIRKALFQIFLVGGRTKRAHHTHRIICDM